MQLDVRSYVTRKLEPSVLDEQDPILVIGEHLAIVESGKTGLDLPRSARRLRTHTQTNGASGTPLTYGYNVHTQVTSIEAAPGNTTFYSVDGDPRVVRDVHGERSSAARPYVPAGWVSRT